MSAGSWIALLAAAGFSEVVGTMAGFGAATVFTPLAMLFFEPKTAIALVAVFHLFGTGSRLLFFGRHIDWRLWVPFGFTGLAGSWLGASIATRLSSAAMELLVGGFLLLYAAGDRLLSSRVRLPAAQPTLLFGGAASGLIAGVLGTGGTVRAVCLLAFGLPQAAYLGTSAALALLVDATRVPVYVMHGWIPTALIPVLISLAPVAFSAAWAGQRMVRRLSPELFHLFILLVLTLMGLRLILQGWHHLAPAVGIS